MHIQKVSGIGGSERHLLALLPALSARSVEVRMCVMGDGEFNRFVEPLKELGIDFVVADAGGDISPRMLVRLVREIRNFQPDLVHTHLIHADVYGQIAARIAGMPGISSMHSAMSFYRRRPYRTAARLAGSLARQTIAISEHVRRFLEELRLTPIDRVRVVHYGIDTLSWVRSESESQAARARLRLTPQDVAVGIASRLVPDKGHELLLEAMAEALRGAPELRLIIAGDGPLRARLEGLAARLFPTEVVRFIGYVDDVRPLMNACDVVIHPSLGEGFGLAALEAMAAGRPVVATRLDSLPEIVIDGETGFLVSPGTEELAQRLVVLARNRELREKMGARGRERARTKFTIEAMTEKTLTVYREAVGDRTLMSPSGRL